MRIRDATAADADSCAAVYAPYVRDTAISFETEPPGPVEMAERIAEAQQRHAWLVVTGDDCRVAGYAYGAPFRGRAAYRWTCEVSVYLAPDARGRGTGRALYEALLARLAERGERGERGAASPQVRALRLRTRTRLRTYVRVVSIP
ncbi:N-acetyltransferase family protein [Pseudonocardia sp. NPDC049635]|uniref:GNAT family N-acetyltransferase n=1 Tax=Pseudonocardia sp. NPDC049635 TaxID=3155506 RepID=UPI00340E5080